MFKAPEATRSDHRALEQEIAQYVQAQTYKPGAITERSVPSEVFAADRELNDVYFKIARQ